MPFCPLCGKKVKNLFKIEIEGSILEVCENCTKFGKRVIEKPKYQPIKKIKAKKLELEELIPDYGKIIKLYRERKGMTRKDFAKALVEKESVIRRIEESQMEPDEQLRKKIEKLLGVSLVRKYEETKKLIKRKKKLDLTVGDVIEVK